MRVVHQLIDYFRARGALSEVQIAELREQGFLPDGDAETARVPVPASDRGPRSDDGDDPDAPALRRRKPLGVEELCAQISAIAQGWPQQLEALFAIGHGLLRQPTLSQTLLLIRQAPIEQLEGRLAALLASRTLRPRQLSQALDLQDYRAILRPGRQPTQALGAYRALMRTQDFASLGKYAWILRHPPVNDVFNLIQAKRKLLAALREIYLDDIQAFAGNLRGQAPTSLFWAFVILRSASADDPWFEARHKTALTTSYLDRIWPPDRLLARAALYALVMAPTQTLAFLTRDLDVPADARGNPPWTIPNDWTSDAEKHYINFRRRAVQRLK